MARDGAPNDTSDTGDTGEGIVVPITAPGSSARDFTISPASPAEPTRSTERTSSPEDDAHRHDGSNAHRTGGTDALLDDDTAHDHAIGGLGLAPHADAAGRVVGHDRLADVVTTFGATLDAIRASQGRAARHNLPTGSGTNQKRIAQVVQATPIDATRVVELIRSNAARVPLLALDADDPAVGRGDVAFPGRLRMPGGTRRRVELRVYPTVSGNLTVLELLPKRSWMHQTRRYLRAGVPAITALSDAIEEAAATT